MIHATKIDMDSLMLLLKSLLFLSAVTLAIDETSGNNDRLTDKSRLTDDVIPLKYELSLELHDTYRNTSSRGVCRILVLIKRPTRNIRFHADRSQIQELTVNLLKTKDKLQRYQPTSNSYDVETDINTFYFDEELSGYYKVFLMFANVEDNNKGSFFRTSFINNDGNRIWVVATDLWPMGARRLFPCWDEPIFQANFSILIKHPKSYKILSNMPKQKTSITEQSDMMWTHFEDTPPIPTYHVSAILSSFSSTTTTVHIEYKEHLNDYYIKFALAALQKITEYFKSQRMYLQNLKQLSHVAIPGPGFRHNVVSNLGLISYRETAIIFDEEKDSLMREIDIARLLGHAVAYQCLSNRFGPSSWSYMWLNQGISTLLAMDAIDQVYPNYHIKDLFVVQTLQEALRLDTDSVMKPLISEINGPSDIDSGFYYAYYVKAPAILRMLQQMLGEEVFQNGTEKYLNVDPSYSGKTNIETFWTAMQAAHEEHKYDVEHFNVKERMEAWTMREHYPVIKVTQNETFIKVTTESTNTNEKEWWIPYISAEKDSDFLLSKSIQYISTAKFHINYVNKDWLIVNLQQIGYYRVNYNAQSLEKIANYLNSDKYIRVHVLNRAQIMDDAFHFLIRGQLDLSVFEKLTTYLSMERNYIAWYPMFKAFEYLSSIFPFEKSSSIKSKMITVLDKLHQEIGYKEKSDPVHFSSLLKQEVARWACVFGSSECKKQAYFKLKAHLDHQISLLPWWKGWTYCNGLAADSIIWIKIFKIYLEKHDYTILKYLACSEDIYIIRSYLSLIASKHYVEKIKDNGRIYIFHSIVARHAKNDTTLDYILENFDNVKPRNMSMTVALTDIINHVYSKSSLDKVNKFLDSYLTIWPNDLFTHPLIDDRLHIKLKKCTRDNHMQGLIIFGKVMLLKCKIKLRLSEIMRHNS